MEGIVLREAATSAGAEPMLRARDLTLGYGGHVVLRGVDLEVRAGEAWYLVGPNGSGKTTLLRAALGTLAPRSGALERDDRLADGRGIGFVPQTERIGSALPTTVREFVSLGFAASAVPRPERSGRLAWALARTGLTDLARSDYAALSGGQQRRTLLARALVRRPTLLVLDEPTEGLDVASEGAFLAALDELHREQGMTLVVVTHRLALAAEHATHLAIFHDGRVLAGPRDEVLRRAASEGVAFADHLARAVRDGAGS